MEIKVSEGNRVGKGITYYRVPIFGFGKVKTETWFHCVPDAFTLTNLGFNGVSNALSYYKR